MAAPMGKRHRANRQAARARSDIDRLTGEREAVEAELGHLERRRDGLEAWMATAEKGHFSGYATPAEVARAIEPGGALEHMADYHLVTDEDLDRTVRPAFRFFDEGCITLDGHPIKFVTKSPSLLDGEWWVAPVITADAVADDCADLYRRGQAPEYQVVMPPFDHFMVEYRPCAWPWMIEDPARQLVIGSTGVLLMLAAVTHDEAQEWRSAMTDDVWREMAAGALLEVVVYVETAEAMRGPVAEHLVSYDE